MQTSSAERPIKCSEIAPLQCRIIDAGIKKKKEKKSPLTGLRRETDGRNRVVGWLFFFESVLPTDLLLLQPGVDLVYTMSSCVVSPRLALVSNGARDLQVLDVVRALEHIEVEAG